MGLSGPKLYTLKFRHFYAEVLVTVVVHLLFEAATFLGWFVDQFTSKQLQMRSSEDMCDASSLIVYVVCETGLVADWNQANPAKSVQKPG